MTPKHNKRVSVPIYNADKLEGHISESRIRRGYWKLANDTDTEKTFFPYENHVTVKVHHGDLHATIRELRKLGAFNPPIPETVVDSDPMVM